MLGLPLTQEQKDIVKACLTQNGVIMANAFAGTGKTTTCLASIVSGLQAKWNVLYLVYNKSMEEEAKRRLASMVSGPFRGLVVKTAHAFAYAYMKDRIKGPLGNLRAIKVAHSLDADLPFAIRAIRVYMGFLYSDEDFTKEGLYRYVKKHVKGPYFQKYKPQDFVHAVSELINLVEAGQLPMPHDHYLKFFVHNYAEKLNHFSLVILDEAQDANPVFIQLLKKLGGRTTLLVGDRHQKIYGFRNTVDASLYFKNAHTYYLTESFRFGENVAELANFILAFKGEKKKVKGKGIKKPSNTEAYISRTNSGVLQTILELKRPVRTERPIDDILRPALSVLYVLDRKSFYNLGFTETQIDWSVVKVFDSSEEFVEYVEHPECEDKELISAYNLITKLMRRNALSRLKDVYYYVKADSNVICTTAHSSKGAEYGRVYVKSDLGLSTEEAFAYLLYKNKIEPPPESFCKEEGISYRDLMLVLSKAQAIEEEINLMYVAFTRAMAECKYDPATFHYLADSLYILDNYLSQLPAPTKTKKNPTKGR